VVVKKIPISFNDKEQENIKKLISLMGIEGRGDIPIAIRFSITYTLNQLEKEAKVILGLNDAELGFWLSSVKKFKTRLEKKKLLEKLQKEGI
jgi:hypothetical protein